ncbi:Lar family restriction alleviation protein [Telmatobacter bradus]|uniref:Lar family restriction alleviation protein n=1 Tax=Telmatobacter bradus TaxID=474953 RepID=UPI003B436D73
MDEELKPCPFCGRTESLEVNCLAGDDWFVSCEMDMTCQMSQHAVHPTRETAIIAWNRRPHTMQDATLEMAVLRLGGSVEGRPTARCNFLQRIDELVAKETQAQSLADLLCPVHASLDSRNELIPFDNCIACIRNERDEMREALEGVLPYMEAAEGAGLVGDEGCHWPVEAVRCALSMPEKK